MLLPPDVVLRPRVYNLTLVCLFVCQRETFEILAKVNHLLIEAIKSELEALESELEAYGCAN